MGSANYNLTYKCRMCLPIEKSMIIEIAALELGAFVLTDFPLISKAAKIIKAKKTQ